MMTELSKLNKAGYDGRKEDKFTAAPVDDDDLSTWDISMYDFDGALGADEELPCLGEIPSVRLDASRFIEHHRVLRTQARGCRKVPPCLGKSLTLRQEEGESEVEVGAGRLELDGAGEAPDVMR